MADDEAPGGLTRRSVGPLEAILMVAVDPVPANLLAQLLEVSTASIEEVCRTWPTSSKARDGASPWFGGGGGYRFQSHPDQAPWVELFRGFDGQSSRLTAAALGDPSPSWPTSSRYPGPSCRPFRGFGRRDGGSGRCSKGGYIGEVTRDPGPGNAILYGTTREFLERMGLDESANFRPLAIFVPGPEVVEALEGGPEVRPRGGRSRGDGGRRIHRGFPG
ncbi:MAG: segregation and condensation protein B [Acidimicrobiales bacterium]|nr:MAG: segregation and condensation protein B [Acidimicrobiales bacterium]